MKHCFTLLFLAFSYCSAAQLLPNQQFTNSGGTIPCPYDSLQMLESVQSWEVYQTTNDEWDGPRDSTCINFETISFYSLLELAEVDSGKTVFVRCMLDSSNKVLVNENNLYYITSYIDVNSSLVLNYNDTCPDGYCSGIKVGIEIPDSAGTGRLVRYSDHKLGDVGWGKIQTNFCLITEKFVDDSYIREFIFKFTTDPSNPPNEQLKFNNINIDDQGEIYDWWGGWNPVGIHTGNMSNFLTSQFDYQFSNWTGTNFVVMHMDSGYPNAYNISYVDVVPSPNTATQETVNVQFDNFTHLYYQPFTQFRGGLVQGDTTRHILNLVNNGSDICMEPWMEVIFEGLNSYTHKSGGINFNGKGSCMLFGKGGKLIVDEGSTLHYGSTDEGMLGVFTSGTIEIREGGELIVYNKMMIDEYKYETEPGQVFMELNKGGKLTFAPGSRLIANGIDDLMKLNIYMRGGEIDLSGLPRQDLKNINLIYEIVDADWMGLEVYNSNTNEIEYAFDAMKEGTAEIQVYDLNGKLAINEHIKTHLGKNERYLNTSSLENGVYVLALVIDGKRKTQKFVKV